MRNNLVDRERRLKEDYFEILYEKAHHYLMLYDVEYNKLYQSNEALYQRWKCISDMVDWKEARQQTFRIEEAEAIIEYHANHTQLMDKIHKRFYEMGKQQIYFELKNMST